MAHWLETDRLAGRRLSDWTNGRSSGGPRWIAVAIIAEYYTDVNVARERGCKLDRCTSEPFCPAPTSILAHPHVVASSLGLG